MLLVQGVRFLHQIGKIRTDPDLHGGKLDDVKGILVAVTTALGDSITFTPALTAVRARYPRARIVGLYHHAFSSLYDEDPRFSRMIPYFGKYKRLRRTLAALREESCELALLPYMNDPDIIPLVIAGGSRMLFRMPGRNTVYPYLVVHPELLSSTQPPVHANKRGADMVARIDCIVRDIHASLHRPADSHKRVDAVLAAKGIPAGSRLIGVHPGASIPQKRWPARHFHALGRMILDTDKDARIIVTGSAAERRLCDEVCGDAADGRRVNLAGDIPIRDMPELIGRFDLFIAGDTGIAVMAYAVGCRSLTLFWHTDPAVSGPVEVNHRNRLIQGATADDISPARVLDEALNQEIGR